MLNIKTVIFFGGGPLLLSILKVLIKNNSFKCIVFTSKRHSNEIVEKNLKLIDFLITKNIQHIIYILLSSKSIKLENYH